MRTYATLFDIRYAAQGLALYESLKRYSSQPFLLNILALDHECELVLRALDLEFADVTSIDEFEEYVYGMKEARSNRTYREWCWTCASVFANDILGDDAEDITYLDADVYAFADMEPIFDEIGERSIAITPHQFPDNSEKPRLSKSGLYNVGFIHFKNTEAGRACLAQWAAQVRERCSAEVGCGDQGYLDFFQRDFGSEVCILGHGVNTGPWNLMAYDVVGRSGTVHLGNDWLRCFHFHEYLHGERLTNYPLRQVDKDLIYAPYISAVNKAKSRIESVRQLT